ncbi:MAG: sugar ABC transporter ATP-binding protein [Planctomycetota bacterium]|jgi:ribose transport system ATP-binding protein|nr:sugar ABC transporter ATP-binding protein [Planctomycetota bacterium]
MPTVLEIRALSKSFPGVQALAGVDLTVERGECHALLGENGAGKSTLIKAVCGFHRADSGTMLLDGATYDPATPHDAMSAGIRVVYQEFNLLSYLSIAENIFFDRLPRNGVFVDYPRLYREAQNVLDRIGLDASPRTPVELLGVAQMQLVEIAKALSADCKVLIFDEPTATLSPKDSGRLFDIIRQLKSEGIGIIYISHHLNEIYEVADRLTVLRNGETIGTRNVDGTTIPEIVKMMVGRSMESEYPFSEDVRPNEKVIFETRNLQFKGSAHKVSFQLHEGELLGISGLVGSRRTETLRALFGADPKIAGEVFIHGERFDIRSPRDAVAAGLSLLTEDRKSQGLILDMPLFQNTTMAALDKASAHGFMDRREERRATEQYVAELSIKTPSIQQLCRNLSGGNQQKAVLAKWLYRDSRIIFFDEPTRGIDVGAKYEIYLLLWDLIAGGKGVLIVSSDLNELMGVCHRILVFSNGKIAGEIARKDFSQEKILGYAYQEYLK